MVVIGGNKVDVEEEFGREREGVLELEMGVKEEILVGDLPCKLLEK